MRAEFKCPTCGWATGLAGESESYEDDMSMLEDWNDECAAHERQCMASAEAEAAAGRMAAPEFLAKAEAIADAAARNAAGESAAQDAVVDCMCQAQRLVERADRADATGQPMLAALYRKNAVERMQAARDLIRMGRALQAAAPFFSALVEAFKPFCEAAQRAAQEILGATRPIAGQRQKDFALVNGPKQ